MKQTVKLLYGGVNGRGFYKRCINKRQTRLEAGKLLRICALSRNPKILGPCLIFPSRTQIINRAQDRRNQRVVYTAQSVLWIDVALNLLTKRVDLRGSSVLTKASVSSSRPARADQTSVSSSRPARADKIELMYSVPVLELIPLLIYKRLPLWIFCFL